MPDHIPHAHRPDDIPEPGSPEPELRAALRAHYGDVPAVDWDALEARVADAARFRLAGRVPGSGWRRSADRWGRVAIPAGLAATLLLAAGLAFSTPGGDDEALAVDEIVAVAASDALPLDPLTMIDQDAFLAAVLDPAE